MPHVKHAIVEVRSTGWRSFEGSTGRISAQNAMQLYRCAQTCHPHQPCHSPAASAAASVGAGAAASSSTAWRRQSARARAACDRGPVRISTAAAERGASCGGRASGLPATLPVMLAPPNDGCRGAGAAAVVTTPAVRRGVVLAPPAEALGVQAKLAAGSAGVRGGSVAGV